MNFLLLVPLLLGAEPTATEPAPVIELRAEARTPGTRILVEDVVTAAAAALLPDELLAADLGRSPSPGFGRLVTRRAVEAALPEGTARVTGPEEITVRTDVVRVAPVDIAATAREFFEQTAPLLEGTMIEISRQPFEVTVPRGRDGIELVPRFRADPSGRGNVTVLTEVRVDGSLQLVVPTTFLARTFSELPVLAVDLGRGQTLASHHVATVRTETTQMMAHPVIDIAPFLGRVARRNLRAGTPLRAQDYEPAVLVKRNEPVTLVFASGMLRAEVFGIARDNGTLGSPVRVENLTTRKQMVGRVAGPGLVQMNP